MPTYEYACSKCHHRFEEFQSITAKPISKCPKCKKGRVKRLIGGGAGFLFKGSGFYQTDYRSAKYQESAKKEKDSVSPKTDSSSAKSSSESKPKESKDHKHK